MIKILVTIFFTTAGQLATIFGFFFIIGFILAKLQQATQKIYLKSVGWYGILWTGWIGTPVHELGHYIFAKIFGHRVEKVSLFRPNRATGMLGEVTHSYNKHNPYHSIGNFFIGAAPMIFGCIILGVLFHFLMPNRAFLLAAVQKIDLYAPLVYFDALHKISTNAFSGENFHSYRFWLFIYISLCVAAHLAPSSYDLKTMGRGLIAIFILLFLINGAVRLFNFDLPYLSGYALLPFLVFTFWYALIVSLLHLIVAGVVLFPIRLIRR